MIRQSAVVLLLVALLGVELSLWPAPIASAFAVTGEQIASTFSKTGEHIARIPAQVMVVRTEPPPRVVLAVRPRAGVRAHRTSASRCLQSSSWLIQAFVVAWTMVGGT